MASKARDLITWAKQRGEAEELLAKPATSKHADDLLARAEALAMRSNAVNPSAYGKVAAALREAADAYEVAIDALEEANRDTAKERRMVANLRTAQKRAEAKAKTKGYVPS